MSRTRSVAILAAGLVVAGAAIQFVPIERTNPPVSSDLAPPPDVESILRRSCYDCHSHETRWPWYAYVAPTSWLVSHDVEEAREELNFSAWKSYRIDKRRSLFEDVLEEIDEGEMPPWSYRLVHRDAGISDAERETLRGWILDGER